MSATPADTATARTGELEIDRLSVAFGGVVAVDELSIAVPKGTIRAIIGPNGAGKTTLLNCISGLVRATGGTVRFDGRDITHTAAWKRSAAGIGRTFQNPSLADGLTVVENVEVGLFAEGGSSPLEDALTTRRSRRNARQTRERSLSALAELGIERYADLEVGTLPVGTRKLVDLARAWVLKPPLMLIDEPTAGLGEEEIAGVDAVLSTVRGHSTIVVIAHHLDFVMNLADEVTVLNFGKEVITGLPLEVSESPEVMDVYIGSAD
ncbi:MAG TPA: ABC transporter ATP-binding protein [Solirubrobacterales bacterium]|jgi:branched-chain amino acid transport system ATP-binding protein|nr:ABC transporter ATP-binding protein [Solirubrobacterales bacterium]